VRANIHRLVSTTDRATGFSDTTKRSNTMKQSRTVLCTMASLAVCMLMAGVALAQGATAPDKPKLDPGNSVWTLTLATVYGDKPLTAHMVTKDGKVAAAFGTGEFNKAVHTVDGSALVVTETSVKGVAKVTINADQWVPVGGKSIDCQFTLDLVVKDGKVGGTYAGKRGDDDLIGMVLGTIAAPATVVRDGKIKLQLEKALEGDVNQQRVYMTVTVAGGKVTKVEVAPKDRFHWSGKVTAQTLTVTAEALTGDVTIEITTARSVTKGVYVLKLDGKVIGPYVAGTLTSKLGDKEAAAPAMLLGSY
jgi:hypothetical protein